MQELATWAIWAVQFLVESLALLRLVVARNVRALLQLVLAMRKRARVRVLARSIQLPKLADFSFELHFEALLASLRCSVSACLL